MGRWETLPEGKSLWRAGIQSPGARGIRLHFTQFSVGTGRVWIHDGTGEEEQISGPYTGAGPFSDGDFWSDIVMADTAIVEFEPSEGQRGQPPFQVGEISHVYSDPKEGTTRSAAASCNLDVTCSPEWAETSRSVGRISFESGGSSLVCSGTLLNTRSGSGTPLFLTANHCIETDAVARTLQAFWFYQTDTCNGTPPSTRNVPRTLGARMLVTGDRTQGDFTLLRLNSVPSGVIFSGWDPREAPEGTALTVVHHPAGDYKRIAFGNRVANPRTPSNFYSVFYSSGLTEGGSSGSGLFSAPLVLVGALSNGPKADTPEQYCRLIPFADNYGRFSSFYPLLRDILEERGVENPTPPPSGERDLTSGVAAPVSLPAVSTGTLFNGTNSYRITVPQGASRLDIVLTTSTPGADVDLFARFGADTSATGGSVAADHKSDGLTGNEQITITPTSTPPLRAGTYFISLGLFTNGVAVNATLTATVTTASAPPPTGSPTVLTSGTPRTFSIAAVTGNILLNGARGFTIDVPQGATRLDVRLSSTTPNVDLDLFVRFGSDPTLSGGNVVADYRSEGDAADETVSITAGSTPPLRAGVYFISVAVFTPGVNINASLLATVTTASAPPPSGVTLLTSGRPQGFTIDAVTGGTLLNGNRGYMINVPQGATRLEISLSTSTPNVDIDLFARFGSDTALSGGNVVADHKSEGPAGNEQIVITATGTPPLRAGTYFISLAIFTRGVQASGTLTATVTAGTMPPPNTGPAVLTSGVRQTYTLPPAAQSALFNGNRSFVIDVAANATRLDIQLVTATAGADVDLFVRFNSDPAVSGGTVDSDYSSTGPDGSERITITAESARPLRPGRYFISLAVFTTNIEVAGSLTATVTTGSLVTPAPTAPAQLTSGTAAKFSLPAIESATLYNGNYSFRIQVPDGATQMRLQLTSDNPAIDVDLYVRHEIDTAVEDNTVLADYASEGPSGNESITVTSSSSPPLRAGNYYISLALFSKGVPATGSIIVTVERGSIVPPTSSAVEITSGNPNAYSLPAVVTPTLFSGSNAYRITVGPQHTRLAVSVRNDPADVDVDLFVRFGQEPALADSRVVSDFRSTTDSGHEDVVIAGANLRPGVYFIAMALFTTGKAAQGTLTAALSGDGTATEPILISNQDRGIPIASKRGIALATALPVKSGEDKELLWTEEGPVKHLTRLKKRLPVEQVR
ncbi:MAG TPA: PPC domain-containing protein [Bryobacteraceae bacterium]|nr:PPC domain-containing protein [Bryobacteraceae bacterium]